MPQVCACSVTVPCSDPHLCPHSHLPSVNGVLCTHPALPFGACGSSPGSHLPSCSSVLTLCLPFHHRASTMCLPSCSAFCSSKTGTLLPSVGISCGANSRLRQALSCAQGTNASDLADMALSALPAVTLLGTWPTFFFSFLTDMYLYNHMIPTHMTAYLYNRTILSGTPLFPPFVRSPLFSSYGSL